MSEKNNGKGIFYGVIGIATLVVAIIGATFAYFTASASNNNVIKGNMATVQLSLAVEKVVKVDEAKNGMIPMSNNMVHPAVTKNQTCLDDNGNAVCQVYKITITNDSSAGQFVDGYVSLRYGSGSPLDFTDGTKGAGQAYKNGAKFVNATKTADNDAGVGTTMRWAQVFESGGNYSTAGAQELGVAKPDLTATKPAEDEQVVMAALDPSADNKNVAAKANFVEALLHDIDDVVTKETISGTAYDVIKTNYIRVSNHDWTPDATGKQKYDRTDDITSALVFNHNIAAGDSADYYIVVWLSENGKNQTAGATVDEVANPGPLNFFDGNVTFISAQGSEVSATFTGFSRVNSQSGS